MNLPLGEPLVGYGSMLRAESGFVDPYVVERLKADALIGAGYLRYSEHRTLPDEDQLALATLNTMLESHVADGEHDLNSAAVTRGELFAQVLPEHRTDVPPVPSLPELAAKQQLEQAIWDLTRPSTDGFVQARLAGSGYVLCETNLARTPDADIVENPTSPQIGRFLTRNPRLIEDYFLTIVEGRFASAADEFISEIASVLSRRPELATVIKRRAAALFRRNGSELRRLGDLDQRAGAPDARLVPGDSVKSESVVRDEMAP